MRWAWVVAAISLAWAGCKPQAAPPPPAVACRVDLPRLVSAHPRWTEVRAMDAQIERLKRRLAQPHPPAATAALPAPLASIPNPEPPQQRALPGTLSEMEGVRDAALRTLRQGAEQRQQARLESRRVQLALSRDQEARLLYSQAFDELWKGQREIIQRYQSEITHLHILVARLSEKSVIPDQEKQRPERLAKATKSLAETERRRKAELQAVERRISQRLDDERKRRGSEDAAAIEELRAGLKSQLEIALRTAEDEWQERVDAAATALQEPPPGPVFLPAEKDAAAEAAPKVTVSALAGVVTPPDAALAKISRQRGVLARFLQAETRARVVGIASRYNLRPNFAGAAGLPDRTEFFLKQIQRPGS